MTKKKKKFLKILIVFFVIEIAILLISGNLNKELHIGLDDSGKFVIKNIEKPFDLQKKIFEDFQPDQYLKEEGGKPQIYGSEKFYNFFKKVFRQNVIGSFRLLRMLLIVDLALIFLAILIRKKLFQRPSKPQILFELIYTVFEEFVGETLGKKNLHFTPYIVTLFIFIWTCNMIGLIPIPGFMEPTRNLNVPLGLGIMAVALVHFMAIKTKGIGKYLKGYAEPLAPLAPLNLVGELSKAVSISFRLFGNILGGSIIILVVSSLVKFIILPVGLSLFFGMFVGTIQAFVFTMLALTYIGVEIAE